MQFMRSCRKIMINLRLQEVKSVVMKKTSCRDSLPEAADFGDEILPVELTSYASNTNVMRIIPSCSR